ncbi:hypothetical protein BDY19DRAFT_86920 [Irpex rosettiformis]|uniref:Uncharacterized protein n=1 Tax=Irpex rosettiformis TaxID=378272 RepID=A0ACB8U781_9APHY|nr:hypothetical protein BDY19DRAFT_86920 [Irpex rosettiformis]
MQPRTRPAMNFKSTPLGDGSEPVTPFPVTSTSIPRELAHSDHKMPFVKQTKTYKQVHVHLDMNLCSPTMLQDEIALESTICALEGYLENPAVNLELIYRDMMAVSNLFEFVFSGVSDRVANITKAHIASMFPSSASSFESSLASSLLGQLSLYFWHQEYPLSDLAVCHNSVELTRPVLKALSSITFGSETKSPVFDDVDDEFEGFFVAKRTKQRDRKKNKRAATRQMSIDTKAFERLQVDVPDSLEDAVSLEQQLLNDQKDILMHYLDVLRKPELTPIFKQAYISLGVATDSDINGANVMQADSEPATAAQQVVDGAGAYPNIQPMKAALYFDSVEGFGDWRILISTRADKNLREAKRDDQKLFAIYLKKIRELSNGHFSDDNQKRLTGSDNDVPIYEAKMTRDSRLVYQVDCIKEFEADVERQVIRIFGIYTHAQLSRNFWDAVSKQISGKGKEYRKRCVYRTKPVNARDKVYSPAVFPPNADMDEQVPSSNLPDLRPDEQQELHSLLVLEKFVTFSQALLHSILANQDVAHVFHMSPGEQEIVKHPGSCYVLGRSGTGKTTTMLFKMLGIERAYENLRSELDGELARPRQLFVTQSRVLAEKVQEYYVKLAMSQAAAQRTAEESSNLASQQKVQEEKGLFDHDEEEEHHGTLPKSFKELKDEHFPLFVTFDHLCRLLETDYRKLDSKLDVTSGGRDEAQENENSSGEVASDYMLQRRESFVSYITFLNEYWPHLPQPLTKNLDPALIFAEFMGVIKGSEDSVQTEKGYLDRDQYLQVSHRQQGTFSGRRDAVYMLFQAYLKMKRERREWDAADRTHVMLRGLREFGVPGRKVDFIYVDEAQDNLLIDALVLRSMCNNPEGLFWAGDTAQTISAGSSFRFDDLKAFLYRVETKGKSPSGQKQPAAFQLTTNYRSHGGIVNAAHSIVQLITKLWPHAIDVLSGERGIVDGLKPVFFSGWNQDTVHYEQFLFGASGSQIEFGARQCILVRDDDARDRLRAQVGDIGLVLTLYESKGLEFDDVFLYNFFEDSTVDEGRWRVVLNALPPQNNLKCPQFDETRHSGVCRELKFLYVAITRARKNLWIADCSDRCKPLRTYWDAHKLVDNRSSADSVPRLATKSTAEEWAETARILFDKKRYLQASRSYERANMMRERDVAHAYFLREQARRIPRTRGTVANPRRSALLVVAKEFYNAARATSLRSEKLAYYRIAAESYFEADSFEQAGKAYLLAEEHTRAAQVFRQGGLFDEAVDAIEKHRDKVKPEEAENILNVAKLHYFKIQDLDRAIHLFEDAEEALEYMSDYGFNVARVTLLERYGRFGDAAAIYLEEGRPIEAIRLFMRDSANPDSRDRAADSVLQGLWNEVSFGVVVPSPGSVARSQLDQLLSLSKELTASVDSLAPQTLDKLSMFRAIAEGDYASLQALSQKFTSTIEDPAAALLCLDCIFQRAMNIQVASIDVVLRTLQNFAVYTREMQGILVKPDPCLLVPIQKLFAFSQDIDQGDVFVFRKGSFLHTRISQTRQLSSLMMDDNETYQVSTAELTWVFQRAVRDRLNRRTNDEDFQCSKAMALRLCPAFLAFGTCNTSCGSTHDMAAVGPEPFHLRVRVLLQQVLICQSTRDSETLSKQQMFWLSRFYHVLFPVHVKAGSWLDLDTKLVPEAEKGLSLVREWLRDFLYNASFKEIGRPQFLTNIASVMTLELFLEKDNAVSHFNRAACITSEKPYIYLRNKDRYIVQDLRDFLSYDGTVALSAGVLFVKSVFEGRLPIDIAVLCNLLEQLCASYVVASRMQKSDSLHNVTLSRKWMMKIVSDEKLRDQEIVLMQMLVNWIPVVLEETYGTEAVGRSSSFLTYEGSFTIRYQLRNLFAARLCKSFTLLGYNIPDDRMRNNIHLKITSLKKSRQNAHFPKVLIDYMDARTWNGLVKALRRTVYWEAGTAEELVHLWHFSKGDLNKFTYKGIQKVVFKKQADIPALLRGEFVSDLNPQAAVFMPRPHLLAGNKLDNEGEDEDEDATHDLLAPPAEEDSGIDHAIDLEAAARAADQERVEQVAELPTEEELQAAAFIASLYRRKLAYRHSTPKKGREAELERHFKQYREHPYGQRTDLRYKALFLGFLPLLSFCLQTYNAEVTASKKKAMVRMKIVPHHEYESVVAQIDSAIAMNKRINKLKEKVEFKSPFHHKQSEPELVALVKEVEALANELPEAVSAKAKVELDEVVDMIVPKPIIPPTKFIKPELVIDYNDYEVY